MENKNKISSIIFGILGVMLLLALDRITKNFALTGLKNTEGIDLIPGVLRFEYLENRGAAFGVMQGMNPILLFITVVILVFVIYAYIRIPEDKKYLILKLLSVFIIAGAVGNMIDRIIYQFVVDFIYFQLIDFPVFNVADCYITVSVLALFILIIFYYKDDELTFLTKRKVTPENDGNE